MDTRVGSREERSPQSEDVGRKWVSAHGLQAGLQVERPLAVGARHAADSRSAGSQATGALLTFVRHLPIPPVPVTGRLRRV